MKKAVCQVEDLILDESFQRFVLKQNPEDVHFWQHWMEEHPDSSELILNAREIITFIATRRLLPKHQSISNEVFDRLQKQIAAEMPPAEKPQQKINFRYYWVAASVAFLLGFGIFYSFYLRTSKPNLSAQFLEVIVPKGQRSQLLLPDGTRVWLNSGTIFKYPVNFLTQERHVYVEGEAFFNVKHRNNLPFTVHLREKLSIKVLGTEFNVKSYADDKDVETTLINGKIRLIKEGSDNQIVRELILKPNEKATYLRKNAQIIVSHLATTKNNTPAPVKAEAASEAKVKDPNQMGDVELITSWKDEALVFHNETFEEIGIKMERWFGLKITIADETLKKEKFTGKFVNKESIYQILDVFNRSESIQYRTKNKEIIIAKKIRTLKP